MFITDSPLLIVGIIGILFRIAIIAAIIVLIVKGIKYLKRAEAREIDRDNWDARATIDEIERELNEKRERP